MLLGEMLVERGVATVEEIEAALERQRKDGGHLGAHLIGMNILTAMDLYKLLKEQKDALQILAFCEHMVARWGADYGPEHPTTLEMRCKLAQALLANGRAEEAYKQSQLAYDCLQMMKGKDSPLALQAQRIGELARSAAQGRGGVALARLRATTAA
jgi:hypothetical protein